MPVTWKIYGIFHPHTHDLLYIGQTRRAIHERKEEHLLDIKDTLISKKIRQIKETTGQYPDFGILQDGIKAQNERSCHQRKSSSPTPLISILYAAINGIRFCISNSNVPYGLIWA